MFNRDHFSEIEWDVIELLQSDPKGEHYSYGNVIEFLTKEKKYSEEKAAQAITSLDEEGYIGCNNGNYRLLAGYKTVK